MWQTKFASAVLKIWDWDWIFGRAVKAVSSLGVRSPWMHANFKNCMCIPKWDHAKAVKQMRWFDRLLMVLYFTDIMGKMVAMCQKTSDKYFCINFWPCKEICMRNKYMTETQCLGGSTIHSLVTFLKTKVTSDYWVASAFHWPTGLWICWVI